MTPEEGLCYWRGASSLGEMPTVSLASLVALEQDRTASVKALWIIGLSDVCFAQERGSFGQLRGRGYLAHTNLTGGDAAHSGGEMWLTDDGVMVLNGDSGRYRPRSAEELDEACEAFSDGDIDIISMGWDVDLNRPARTLRIDSSIRYSKRAPL